MRRRPWILAFFGVLSLVVGTWVSVHLWNGTAHTGDQGASGIGGASRAAHDRRLPSLGDPADLNGGAGASGLPSPEASIATRVEPLMKEWRLAIINKNPETVESLDRVFAAHPREFVAALMTSAESDPEERVRSFSTRVLGKLRPPESAELMRKLLSDRSEFVRFNAAWALGELADRAALARLRQLQLRDPSPNVRRSASASLVKMDGG